MTNVLAPNEAVFVTENTVEHTNAKFRNPVTSVWWCTQKNVKTTAQQLHFPHEADHVICYSYETRHTVYYVTVRSRTSCSSTNEDQVYLCVPTEQRRLVAKRTRKILHGVFSFLKNLVWTSTSRDSLSFLNLFLSLASGPPYGDQWAPFS